MNTAELGGYIDKIYRENPCVEKKEPVVSDEMMKVLREYRRQDYAAYGDGRIHTRSTVNTGSGAHDSEDMPDNSENELSSRYVDEYIDSLSYNLKSQLDAKKPDRMLKTVAEYLIDLLEDNGWLTAESIASVRSIGVPEELVDKAVELIKTLEPAGVGAAGLGEFIRLQLERYYPDEKLAMQLADERYLESLAKRSYKGPADKLGVSIDEVRAASELIASLNSDISINYEQKTETVYVSPDVFIYKDSGGRLRADTNEYDVPAVSVSEKYLEMYKTTDDKELRDYLRDKINEAYRLIGNIGRRSSSIQRCFDFVVKEQQDYLLGMSPELKPMTMTDAAEELGVNVSTVSRCLMHKYVQCPQGLVEAKYFFQRAVPAYGDTGRSRQGAEHKIAELIAGEDKARPLSDSRLCELMNQEGYSIRRRTAAKYREALGIPDSRERRSRYMK